LSAPLPLPPLSASSVSASSIPRFTGGSVLFDRSRPGFTRS
jgi:hypothetical protein